MIDFVFLFTSIIEFFVLGMLSYICNKKINKCIKGKMGMGKLIYYWFC